VPELPEVETIRRSLEREFLGRRLERIKILEPRLLQNCSEKELKRALVGQKLEKLGRRAKFLLLEFGQHSAVLHLRMTGWFHLASAINPRLILEFDKQTLYFEDTRRFATLHLAKTEKLGELKPLARLGIEPFHPNYTLKNFRQILKKPQEIKRLLLDQTQIAGIGNIYASEALFASRIHPLRPANRLNSRETKRLFTQIEKILTRAIEAQGTTIASYRSLDGTGNFQNFLAVYERAGQPCPRCTRPIARLVQGGRSSYFCPGCQTL
jgi:formamidopyrimidine-DNA glycosylase